MFVYPRVQQGWNKQRGLAHRGVPKSQAILQARQPMRIPGAMFVEERWEMNKITWS